VKFLAGCHWDRLPMVIASLEGVGENKRGVKTKRLGESLRRSLCYCVRLMDE